MTFWASLEWKKSGHSSYIQFQELPAEPRCISLPGSKWGTFPLVLSTLFPSLAALFVGNLNSTSIQLCKSPPSALFWAPHEESPLSRRAPRSAAKSPQQWHFPVFYFQILSPDLWEFSGAWGKKKPTKTPPNHEMVLNCSIGVIKGKKLKIASLKKIFLRLTMPFVGLMKLKVLPGSRFWIYVILKNNPQIEPKSSKTPLPSQDKQKQKRTSGMWREDPGTHSVLHPWGETPESNRIDINSAWDGAHFPVGKGLKTPFI